MRKNIIFYKKNFLPIGVTLCCLVFLAACGGGGSSGGSFTASQASGPAFIPPPGITANIVKIDASLCDSIAVYVSVNDENSQTVLNLTEQNFQVFEDGMIQTLTDFSYEDFITESIVFSLALDYSLSLSDQDLSKIEEAASYFVNQLYSVTSANQLDNWGEIVKFVKQSEVLQAFTNSENDLIAGIEAEYQDRLDGKKGTGLYDAIGNSINRLVEFRNFPPAEIPERSILIVITDGKDNFSDFYDEASNIVAAKGGGIQIITIGIGADVDGQSLYNLATETGGLYFYAPTPDDLLTILTQFLNNLSNQYVLKYTTAEPGSPNLVELDVSTPDGSGSDALGYACP